MPKAVLPVPDSQFWWLLDGVGGSGLAGAWQLATGTGVRVAVVDEGINQSHAGLSACACQSLDPVGDQLISDAGGTLGFGTPASSHGTEVAGLIFGRPDMQIGSIGGAFAATMIEARLDLSAAPDPASAAAVVAALANVDVANLSWGVPAAFGDNFLASTYAGLGQAVQHAVSDGRDGLGTVLVVAGGNGRMMVGGENRGDSSEFHNLPNSRQTIAVGASAADGSVAFFSSPGANLLLAAPGLGLTSASGTAAGSTEFATVSGTSFAAPLVSAAVALMLEVNPDLGYRDVQEILALTARPQPGGTANGGAQVNGGGLFHDNDLGFGILDAAAAVRMARYWTSQSTAANEQHRDLAFGPRLNADGHSETLRATAANADGFSIDWVELHVTLTDADLAGLRIELIAPSGTHSVIAENLAALGTRSSLDFSFTTAADWGEDPNGEWQLLLSHPDTSRSFYVYRANLTFYGDADHVDDVMHFTDAYGPLAQADSLRRVITDSDGGQDRLDFSAATTSVLLDLGAGTGRFAGVDMVLNGSFEQAVGSAAADVLVGSAGANLLIGDGGRDWLDGGGGADVMVGGTGNDRYVIDDAGDRIDERAGEGHDRVISSVSLTRDQIGDNTEILRLTGAGDLSATGNDLANRIIGNRGNNYLSGGGGNDRLDGGAGRDLLRGGDGADSFVFHTIRGGPDRVEDFTPGTDHLLFARTLVGEGELAEMFAIGDHATAADQRLLWNPATGVLMFDPDGNGVARAHALVELQDVHCLGLGDLGLV